MQNQLYVGIVDWVKSNEFGVLHDGISGAELFFHYRQNLKIGKVAKDVICIFEVATDRRRGSAIAVDIRPITEVDPSVIYNIIQDNLSILLGKPFFSDLVDCLEDCDVQRVCDELLPDIDRIDTEFRYEQVTKYGILSMPLGRKLRWKVRNRLRIAASPYYRIKLWYYGHVDVLDEEALWECYFQIDELGMELYPKGSEYLGLRHNWSEAGIWFSIEGNLTRATLCKRVDADVLLPLFLRTIAEYERIMEIGEEPWAEILNASLGWKAEHRYTLMGAIWQKIDDPIRLQLWLGGLTDQFDFGAFKVLFPRLTHQDQFRFVRRLFREAELKRFDLTIAHLDELMHFDLGYAGYFDLACSIDIALHALSDLAADRPLTVDRNIDRVLVRHFNWKAFEKYEIHGFFDMCEGRCNALSNGNGPQGQPSAILIRSNDKPQGVIFCEGRLAQQLDKKYGLKFWWCRNYPCFAPCHIDHELEEWEKYTIRDMLRILQVRYDPDQFQVFQGMVNRTNSLLKHLNCRQCNRILTPQGQSNFGFYRATKFICSNEKCTSKQVIYLNHCLNGKCLSIIDSRDSAQCPNGMYVCTKCYSCCSTKGFARRIENLKNVGLDSTGELVALVENNQGHAEQGRSFCYGCGSELVGGTKQYLKVLKWLIDNRGIDSRIKAFGQREYDDGWWFIVDFPVEKYSNLTDMGFGILPTRIGNGRMVSTPRGGPESTKGKCPNKDCMRFGIYC